MTDTNADRSSAEVVVDAHERRLANRDRPLDWPSTVLNPSELKGTDSDRWLVRTESGTKYLIDFETKYIWRVTSPQSRPGYGLGNGVFYAFHCVVGERAMWRLFGGRRPDFHTVHTSRVLSIESVHPDDFAAGSDLASDS